MIERVAAIVEHTKPQSPVTFIPATWKPRLRAWPAAERVLLDDRFSTAVANDRRTVTREELRALVRDTDLDNPDDVIRAFTMIVIWGSGTRSRSYRNLPRALGSGNCVDQLTSAAVKCRRGELEAAYREMALRGIGPAFFTKWFAFCGVGEGTRPLILDARVRRTLHRTLEIRSDELGHRASGAVRYRAYVELLHGWAAQLTRAGTPTDAEQVEFALFAHNGEALPAVDS